MTRPQLLPGALAYSESVLGVLNEAGMDALTTFTTHLTVFTFVRGTAVNLDLEADAEAASGQTSDEWMAEQEPMLEALVADGRHPHFAQVLRDMEFDLDLDQLFEFGLQRLLDGIAAMPATDPAFPREADVVVDGGGVVHGPGVDRLGGIHALEQPLERHLQALAGQGVRHAGDAMISSGTWRGLACSRIAVRSWSPSSSVSAAPGASFTNSGIQ